tara:strand:- start:162 stop:311 length:150 start_codon:yes stop_codon:yes gene_type:complete
MEFILVAIDDSLKITLNWDKADDFDENGEQIDKLKTNQNRDIQDILDLL